MLPSRGLSRSIPASALRSCLPGHAKAARPLQVPVRNFSGLKATPNLARVARHASPLSRLNPAVPTASVVFASRMGASRNLSFWGFGNAKPQPPPTTSPAATPDAAITQTPTEEAVTWTPSTASTPADAFPAPPAESLTTPGSGLSLDDLELLSILDIPEQIGYLKNLGLDFGWGPTSMCEWLVEHVYVYSGMPWWAAIATVAIGFRAAMVWPTFTSSRHAAKMAQAQKSPEYQRAQEAAKASTRTQDTQAMMAARGQMKAIVAAHGVQMRWLAVPFLTVPFSFGMFRLMRGMAAIPVPSLENGGFLWFADLTIHDPFYVLPILNAALGVLMFRQTQKANLNPTPMMAAAQSMFTYILPPVVFLSTAWLPAAVQWFFLCLTSSSVMQTAATLNPAVRKFFDLPPLPKPAPAVTSSKTAGANWQAPAPTRKRFTDEISSGVDGIKEGWNSATGGDADSIAWKKAEEYEKRRAAEEIEKSNKRMEDQRRRRANKNRR